MTRQECLQNWQGKLELNIKGKVEFQPVESQDMSKNFVPQKGSNQEKNVFSQLDRAGEIQENTERKQKGNQPPLSPEESPAQGLPLGSWKGRVHRCPLKTKNEQRGEGEAQVKLEAQFQVQQAYLQASHYI